MSQLNSDHPQFNKVFTKERKKKKKSDNFSICCMEERKGLRTDAAYLQPPPAMPESRLGS